MPCCFIVPPDVLERLARDRSLSAEERRALLETLRFETEWRRLRDANARASRARRRLASAAPTNGSAGPPEILVYDCAHGTLDHPLQVDERGRFSVAGTFVPEHGGPVRAGEVPESRPARYQGRLDRQKLEFTVTTEGQTGSEPFTVTLGKSPKLTKCL